jgi:hypothetical protein
MKAFVVAAAAMLLTGCIPSLAPLYTDRDIVSDARVTGTWTAKESTMTVAADGNGYKVAYAANENPAHKMNFKAHLVKLGNSLFVDLFPEPPGDMFCFPCIPMHMFGKLTIQGNTLKVDLFDPGWFNEMAKAGKITTAHTAIENDYILSAKTAEVQAFVLKYANDPKAFVESDVWTKKQ